MLNISTLEQKDFQGGQILNLPDNLIPENGVLRLLNMLPGDAAEPLALRGGFQPWSYGYEFGSRARYVTRFTAHIVADADPDSPYLGGAFLVAYNSGTTGIAYDVIIPQDDSDVPDAQYITDEIVWSAYGASTDMGTPTEPPPKAPDPLDTISMMYVDIPNKTAYPTPDVAINQIEDYWPSNSGTLGGALALNNFSTWGSDDSIFQFYGQQMEEGDWDSIAFQDISDWWIGDRWGSDTITFVTQDGAANDQIQVKFPFYQTLEIPSTAPTASWRDPQVHEPRIEILDLDVEAAKRPMRFIFAYDLTDNKKHGMCAHIYVRQWEATSWGIPVNGASKPIVLTQQDTIAEAERHIQVFSNPGVEGTVAFDYTCPYAKVDIKIVFLPSYHFVGNGDDIGGVFRSLVVT